MFIFLLYKYAYDIYIFYILSLSLFGYFKLTGFNSLDPRAPASTHNSSKCVKKFTNPDIS